jgi:hypothetical protein
LYGPQGGNPVDPPYTSTTWALQGPGDYSVWLTASSGDYNMQSNTVTFHIY